PSLAGSSSRTSSVRRHSGRSSAGRRPKPSGARMTACWPTRSRPTRGRWRRASVMGCWPPSRARPTLGELARELGSSELAWHAALHRTCALLESGDVEGAERALVEVERLAGELRQPFYTWFARMEQTMFAVMR